MIDLTNTQTQDPQEEIPEIKRGLWNIDSVIIDGQVKAGKVDKSQEEFLKHTEWAK